MRERAEKRQINWIRAVERLAQAVRGGDNKRIVRARRQANKALAAYEAAKKELADGQ